MGAQVRQEEQRRVQRREVVCCQLGRRRGEEGGDGGDPRAVAGPGGGGRGPEGQGVLDSRVQGQGRHGWVGCCDAGRPVGQRGEVCHVEGLDGQVGGAVFGEERFEARRAAGDGYDAYVVRQEALREG